MESWDNPVEWNRLLESFDGNSTKLAEHLGINKKRAQRRTQKYSLYQSSQFSAPGHSHNSGWGLSPPPLLPPATRSEHERVVGFFDLHGKHHVLELLGAGLRFCREWEPHRIVIGGDLWDFDTLSRWSKEKRGRLTELELRRIIKSERDDGTNILKRIRKKFPDTEIIVVEGNHDQRYREWLTGDPHEGWEEARKDLGLDDLGIPYYNRAGFFLRQDFGIRHGARLTVHAAKAEYDHNHISGWTGHKHDDQKWVEVFPESGKLYEHHVAPCMCHLDAAYRTGHAGLMRWPQGFLTGLFHPVNPYEHSTQVARWFGGRLMVHGQVYA